MNSSDLPKPWKYKGKWMIWPNTVFDIIDIVDCNDTINGVCLKNKTIQECIDTCVGSCAAGYNITFEDGRSVCVPIRTDIHPYLNPAFRLRKKSLYQKLDNVRVSTFINTDIFPFPPESANMVFYRDIITIENPANGDTIGTETTTVEGNSLIQMGKGDDSNVQLIPDQESASQINQYMPLRYGDPFQVSVPATALRAKESDVVEGALEWESSTGETDVSGMAFKVVPIDGSKNIGDIVTYDDIFALQYAEYMMVVISKEHDMLFITHTSAKNILEVNSSFFYPTFRFKSKMIGYYCDKTECKPIPIKDIETFGPAGRYKGVTVGRDKKCWGICNYLIPGTNDTYPLSTSPPPYRTHGTIFTVIISMSLLTILIIIFIRLFVTKKR